MTLAFQWHVAASGVVSRSQRRASVFKHLCRTMARSGRVTRSSARAATARKVKKEEDLAEKVEIEEKNPTPKVVAKKKRPREEEERGRKYYLFKSEGEARFKDGVDTSYSIDQLASEPEGTTCWDGVRNYQARNVMEEMRLGDLGFFYHSRCKPSGIVGIVSVVKEAYPDYTQFDEKEYYYDPKSKKDDPTWYMVDVRLVRRTKRMITLPELKSHRDEGLQNMTLLNNPRLSVQRVTEKEWNFVLALEETETAEAPVEKDDKKKSRKEPK